ncbi:putative ankyrin repeat protein RF_0580 [Ptychodera flava]|uniref:putative ankyrin repeat protein RF_0580 n=1 Tax=Ptychodera flava TaxID=63121 RepID=UPI00396A1933
MKTPLHLAAESDKVDIARQLLKAGAHIELKDSSGESPIQITKTNPNSQMLMVLRGEEPKPKVKTVKGEEKISISPEEQKFLTKIKAFQKSGGDINDQDKDGKIPLHVSTTNNWISAVLFLLDEGAKIGRLDKTGVTPFHVAAVMNHVKILQIFLDRGGDVNKVDEYGCTPLHFAAIGQDCLESVRLLLSAGADPNMRNKNGKTPMDLAVDGKRKEVVSLLKERGAERE